MARSGCSSRSLASPLASSSCAVWPVAAAARLAATSSAATRLVDSASVALRSMSVSSPCRRSSRTVASCKTPAAAGVGKDAMMLWGNWRVSSSASAPALKAKRYLVNIALIVPVPDLDIKQRRQE